ncbi:hypothetical protein KJ969_01240 [Patescibacteria group bacterium]|nr:hypothetical protein [Patescibacteria group bacterium]MBU1921633.1 hypothetical protein [Patescibacteria group bacterium]
MSHKCSSLIVHCMDFRFQRAFTSYMEETGLMGDCDCVSGAGGIKELVECEPGENNYVWKQIKGSYRLHDMSHAVLIAHLDCGAYGGSEKFASRELEFEFHKQELAKAEHVIRDSFPAISVKKVIAEIEGEDNVVFHDVD